MREEYQDCLSRVLPWEFHHWWCSLQKMRVAEQKYHRLNWVKDAEKVGGQPANVAFGNPQCAVYK